MTDASTADRRRAAVVARYGSAEAVKAPCDREALILTAVEPWRKVQPFGGRTAVLDGWFGKATLYGMASRRVVAAIAGAYPMPVTVTEAAVEHAHWEGRNRDLGDLLGPRADTGGGRFLDLAIDMRAAMVRDLAEHSLAAQDLAELQTRFALFRARGAQDGAEIEAAIARDLDALAAAQASGNPVPDRDGMDGTARLCRALYGREAQAADYLGGSDARMLHDAADRLVAPATPAPPSLTDRVSAALRDNPEASDRELARLLGSSHPTISKARQALRRAVQPNTAGAA